MDPAVLDCPSIPEEAHPPILREEMEVTVKEEEMEAAVNALKIGKPAVVDNIPTEMSHDMTKPTK